MNDSAGLSAALSKLDAVKDAMSVTRVFGETYQMGDVKVIPVAAVRGGGGGGGGDGSGPEGQGAGSGAGLGFGVNVRPVGVYVVTGETVTWRPAVDVMRIVLGGQLVAAAALFVVGRALSRREG